jgi:hypothetical protein
LSSESLQIIQRVFLMSHRNRAKSIARSELIRAIQEVLEALDAEGDKLSCMYGFTVKEGPLTSSGSGGVSGIRMPGDTTGHYALWAGVGKCRLDRHEIDEAGSGYFTETRDCRSLSSLLTENCGEIKIKRRKIELSLPALLRELHSRLLEQDCLEVPLAYEETRRPPGRESEAQSDARA